MSHATSPADLHKTHVPIPFLTNTASAMAIDAIADSLLDAELWPEDSELVVEIRAMFMHNWGMDQAQADARMSRFNFKSALAALEGGAA
ncbi:hypothetical protein JAB5_27980 [Janthinobacterium sp. HH103]|uniref:hypothetical protein n=1 Tax=unclassified Janthinobacterium TaxID=2610881 RepID=UPI000873949A|nr:MULTISPECIES: hypothetical protein [unclassified Janthinobacterium]OEZ70778.1 hypothetical protein JAB2_08400 [Janthinobacterium sp. HH100]OEZ76355.1 hypothetical protein JAB5_27980 [Janthinobacterium sp. HH103]QOU72908.1 hypothetical protein JAB4_023610 [Janthinobacterium sp. HH102]